MEKPKYRLSIIIPAFNEAQRLPQTLQEILNYLQRKNFLSEIIVVDDASEDNTPLVAHRILDTWPHKVLRHLSNQGKGASVRTGVLAAEGEIVLFSDADLSTPIEEFDRFEPLLNEYDIVIGSRALKDSRVEIHQPFWREWMGKIYNRIARLVSFKDIQDSQCGFKAFRRDIGERLCQLQTVKGFGFDAEWIYCAQKLGYRIKEVPVVWRNSIQTKVRWQDPWIMLKDLFMIRWRHRNLQNMRERE